MPKSIKKLRHQLAAASTPYALSGSIVAKPSALDVVAGDDGEGQGASTLGTGGGMSRGQRKRLERKQHVFQKLGKWEAPVVTAQKLKSKKREKRDKEDGLLSELERTLKGSEASGADIKPAAASVVTSNKMKREIALREAQRMRLVQEHPAFLADPFAAMRMHIEQSLVLKQQSQQQAEVQLGAPMAVAARGETGLPQSKSHEKRMRQKASKGKMDI